MVVISKFTTVKFLNVVIREFSIKMFTIQNETLLEKVKTPWIIVSTKTVRSRFSHHIMGKESDETFMVVN